MSRRRHRNDWEPPPAPVRQVNRCRILLVIDNQPLQSAAWTALQRARKLLEKVTRDLHRHEEKDEPAFHAWMATTFPTLVSAVREIAHQVEAKSRIIEAVERESFFTGRSPGHIWREWQQSGGRPPEPPPEEDEDLQQDGPAGDAASAFEKEMKRLFTDDGNEDADPFASEFRRAAEEVFGFGNSRPKSGKATEAARTIYRRLVQHLHPDRGGVWTPARARAWEQTQAAWTARDADWLARLEAEWEAGTDLLGPASAIGKLRAALTAIDAARRDVERHLRLYRKDDAWRFSQRPPSNAFKLQIERQLRTDETMLRRELAAMEATLARWTKVRIRPRRPRPPSRPKF